jgi:glycosyltransferase involved in cell wall biosynthesis
VNIQNFSPKVSICVITYNQENYIKQCVESLVSQNADFLFEVVIRDDASSDNTPLILQELKERYSQIRLLNGSVNLGMNKNILEVFGAARGDFIALCEGDDYWVDQCKIKKQVALLEKHSDYNMCCHPAQIQKENRVTRKQLGRHSSNLTTIPFQEILKNDGAFIATPSIMIRRCVLAKLPDWLVQAPYGDYFLQVYGAFSKGCIYSPEPMAVYRKNSIGSWTEQMKNPQKKIAFLNKSLRYFELLADDIGEIYKQDIAFSQAKMILSLALSFLNLGLDEDFKKLIISSWAIQQKVSNKQKIAYYFRRQPVLIRAGYYLSKLIL